MASILNLPIELVNRILYIAAVQTDKKYIPCFAYTGKMEWKLNPKYSKYTSISELYAFRASRPVTTVEVRINYPNYSLFNGTAYPLKRHNNYVTEYIALKLIEMQYDEEDVIDQDVIAAHAKTMEYLYNGIVTTRYVSDIENDTGTYIMTVFDTLYIMNDVITLVKLDKLTIENGQLTYDSEESQIWLYNEHVDMFESIPPSMFVSYYAPQPDAEEQEAQTQHPPQADPHNEGELVIHVE
jgi:hypothetical protein